MSEQPDIDIVRQLRWPMSLGDTLAAANAQRAMAADEIESLRAEVARLTEGMTQEWRALHSGRPIEDALTDDPSVVDEWCADADESLHIESRMVSPWKEETR